MKIDEIDLKIIQILKDCSKQSNKEIGAKIHMTGQAVGIRINKLIDEGIIDNFTINVDKEKLGINILAIVKVYMKSFDHREIIQLIEKTDDITEAYKISGEGCYSLKVETTSNKRLNEIIDSISKFANYKLNISISKIK